MKLGFAEKAGLHHGQLTAIAPVTIFSNGSVPLLGAFGFAGANAVNGIGPGPAQLTTSGWPTSLYCKSAGGGANSPSDQSTASGVTVIGAAEKVPVATS